MENTITMSRISKGGQVTVPAPVRRRWETERVALEDHGDYLLLRPLADPVDGFVGFAAGRGAATTKQLRAQGRDDEALAEARRRG